MEVKWMLAYFLLSSLPVFGTAQKLESLAEKAPATPKELASSNGTSAQKKAGAATSMQEKQKEASPKATPASQPSAPRPSADPIICGLKNNESDFALPSLQCTLQHPPAKPRTADWNKYNGKNQDKNVSGLVRMDI
uniref:Putative isac anti-complement n=1 Tax=Ixodes ricinus TaxID=34613 RepID=A0A0K8RCF7_IXORI